MDFEKLNADVNMFLTKHYTKGRGGKNVEFVGIHYNAGDLTVEGCYSVWQTREASAHYQVESGGRCGQLVHDWDTAWALGNFDANQRSINIEHANKKDGTITEECLDVGAHLTAAICKKFGLGRPEWGKNVKPHSMIKPTQCLPINTTELLTPTGWKKLKDIEIGDVIATVRMDDLETIWSPVRSVVEPYRSDTWTSRDIEATSNHRILYHLSSSNNMKVDEWKNICGCTKDISNAQFYIPNASRTTGGEGLPLTDVELELLIAVQADGHYSRDSRRDGNPVDNVRFHFAKDRKFEKLIDLLDDAGYHYTSHVKKDGTYDVIVDKSLYVFAESYLHDKKFTWDFLNMNEHQREFFLDAILDWDGCRAGNDYSSSINENLDIVQAIAATSGVGSKAHERRVYFKNPERTVRNCGAKRGYDKLVSCVTVDTGFILIRQFGRTSVVGNCPGQIYGSQKDAYIQRAQYWYDKMMGGEPAAPTPTPDPEPSIPQIDVDGLWGTDTTLRIQQVLGAPYKDGKMSRQNKHWKSSVPGCTLGWEWMSKGYGKGSQTIKLIQKKIGVKADGLLGKDTINGLIKYFMQFGSGATKLDGKLDRHSKTIKCMQRRLNEGKF